MEKSGKIRLMKLLSFFLLLEQLSMAQQSTQEEGRDKISIQPFLNFQLWGLNQHYQSENEEINQMLLLFRRGRFGANASIGSRWKMQIQLGMDGLGLVNTDSVKQSVLYQNALSVWSMQAQYKVFSHSEALYLNVGYMLPHISRECVTTPWSVASLDKMRSSVALRYFVTGKNNGISPGITAGGLVLQKKIYYSVAIMPNAFYTAEQPQTQSPLLLGHMLFSFIENEFDAYRYTLPTNGYKQTFGITLGAGGSYQGTTPAFKSNATFGLNLLIAFQKIQVDVEAYKLFRNNHEETSQGYTYHVRGTYSAIFAKSVLQTTMAFWQSKCDNDLYNQPVYMENSFDTGVDFIPNKKAVKVGIHYTYSLAKNKFTYAPSIQSGKYVNAITLKLQATIK